MKKQVLISLIIAVLNAVGVHAFPWQGEACDPTKYEGLGHVIYAKVEYVDADSSEDPFFQFRFDIAAYVDGECRGLTWNAEVGPDEQLYFALRVYGSEADNGKPITIQITDDCGTGQMPEDDRAYQLPETIPYADGATLGQPSNPHTFYIKPCANVEFETEYIMKKGETRQIEVKVTPYDCTPVILEMIPLEYGHVTIDSDLVIHALDYGTEMFFVRPGNSTVTVQVVNPLKDFTLSEEGIYLFTGDSGSVSDLISIVGEDPDDTEHIGCTIEYGTSSSGVLSIDGDTYTAVAKGETKIVFTVTDLVYGTVITKEVTFEVFEPISSITGGSALLYAGIGDDHNLNEYYTSQPTNADEPVRFKIVEYNGINPDEHAVPDEDRCVTITYEGNITARKAGTARVRLYPAYHPDRCEGAYVDIKVEQPILGINILNKDVYVEYGTKMQISDNYITEPAEYTVSSGFTYTSSNTDAVEIEGGTAARALGTGKSVITIRTVQVPTGKEIADSFTLYVTAKVTGFTIDEADKSSHLWMPTNETTAFTLRSEPEGSIFNSSLVEVKYNERIEASVDEEGKLLICPNIIGTTDISVTYAKEGAKVSSVFHLHAGQKYQLPEGWSWLSSPFAETSSSLHDIFGDSLIEVRTRRAVLANDPEWGYFGDVEDFLCDHFKVKMTATATPRVVYGTTVNNSDAYIIKAQAGWTWLPNLFQRSITMEAANEIWGDPFKEGDIIKSKDSGFALYDEGEWTGNLATLEPGEAYMLYTTAPSTELEHPSEMKVKYEAQDGPLSAPARRYWEYDHSRYIDNMAMVARIADFDEGYQDCYTMGVFAGDECRGEGMYVGGLWFITAHGESGDTFTLRIRNKATGETAPLGGAYQFAQLLGSASSPIMLAAPAISGVDDSAIGADICVSGASVVGEGIRIIDLCGNDVTRLNGNLAPGVYVVAKDGMAKKVIIR